jgi:uncharacterized protein YggE
MKIGSNLSILVILVLALGLALSSVMINMPEQEDQTVQVSGTYSVTTEPELAKVRIGYETTELTAKASQENNAEVMDKVKDALEVAGVKVETVSFNVYPNYNWQSGNREITGYMTSHIIEIETTDITDVGKYVDIAMGYGANRVHSIRFDVTDETRAELKEEALSKASEDAQSKADAIASGLGMRVIKVVSIEDQTSSIRPYYFDYAYTGVAMAEGKADTDITPQDLEISANVRATFGLA